MRIPYAVNCQRNLCGDDTRHHTQIPTALCIQDFHVGSIDCITWYNYTIHMQERRGEEEGEEIEEEEKEGEEEDEDLPHMTDQGWLSGSLCCNADTSVSQLCFISKSYDAKFKWMTSNYSHLHNIVEGVTEDLLDFCKICCGPHTNASFHWKDFFSVCHH